MASLKRFTTVDPTARLGIALKLSTRRAIEEYRAFYTAQLAPGHPVERGELIEQLLLAWLDQDTQFQRFRQGLSAEQRAEVEKALGGQADAAGG